MDHSDRARNSVAATAATRIVALPALLLAGAAVSRLLLANASSRWSVDLAQPLVVATNWGTYGALLWCVLAGTLALASIIYLRGMNDDPPSLTQLLVTSGLALAAGFVWLPLFSSDVYAYAAYGEMARLGMNPYLLTHASADPIIAAAQWQWGGTYPICVYGSAFVAFAQTLVSISGAHVGVALGLLRLSSCLAFLACATLLHVLSPRAAWYFAVNPIAIWAALEGHNDALALAIVLAGIVLARRRPGVGSAIIAAAALVKLPALAAGAAFAIDASLARLRAAPVWIGTTIGFAISFAGSLALITGIRTDLAPHGRYLPLASVQALGIPAAAIVAALVLWRSRAFTARIDRWCVVALALWIAIPNPYPWYSLWLLAPSGFAHDPRVRATALAVSGVALLRYLPDAAGLPTGVASIALGMCALLAFTPLAMRLRPVL